MLTQISKDSTLKAMEEFQEIGKEAFLSKYGGGKSRTMFVRHEGVDYDIKVLARGAHEIQGLGTLPPGPNSFRAGDSERVFKRLGFEVVRV